MPESSYQQLLSPAIVSTVNEVTLEPEEHGTYAYDEFMGYNMAAVVALLDYVKKQLDFVSCYLRIIRIRLINSIILYCCKCFSN